uniref:Uncharacterized protein n=1 Tax=Glossina pallidipes TaxID=7398 RepID=A0A1A9ZW34_GLOPL
MLEHKSIREFQDSQLDDEPRLQTALKISPPPNIVKKNVVEDVPMPAVRSIRRTVVFRKFNSYMYYTPERWRKFIFGPIQQIAATSLFQYYVAKFIKNSDIGFIAPLLLGIGSAVDMFTLELVAIRSIVASMYGELGKNSLPWRSALSLRKHIREGHNAGDQLNCVDDADRKCYTWLKKNNIKITKYTLKYEIRRSFSNEIPKLLSLMRECIMLLEEESLNTEDQFWHVLQSTLQKSQYILTDVCI